MAEWGQRAYGRKIAISESDEAIHGQLYEARFTTPVDIPDYIEIQLIEAYRYLYDYVSGTETTYICIGGKDVVIQWRDTGSPLAISTVIMAIVGIAIIFGIYLVLREIYKILEVSPEAIWAVIALAAMAMVWMVTKRTD